jgi:hypothetical protein
MCKTQCLFTELRHEKVGNPTTQTGLDEPARNEKGDYDQPDCAVSEAA